MCRCFFSSRRRHTRYWRDWSSDVCSSDLGRSSYGVFVGFAPFDNPEIAICTIVFDGGHGGESGGLVARAIYERYFKERLEKECPGYKPMFNYELKSNKENNDMKKDDADKNVESNNELQSESNIEKKENE